MAFDFNFDDDIPDFQGIIKDTSSNSSGSSQSSTTLPSSTSASESTQPSEPLSISNTFDTTKDAETNSWTPPVFSSDSKSEDGSSGFSAPSSSEPVEKMTDEEVNDIFDDIAKAMESDTEVLAASAAIMAAEYEVAQAEAEMDRQAALYDEVEKQRKDLEKQLNEVIRRQAEMRDQAYNLRRIVSKGKVQKQRSEKALEVAKQAVRIKYERQASSRDFKAKAIGKAWWEGVQFPGEDKPFRIMDHQWTGCQFLATAGGAILGDHPGTGKTLTLGAGLDLVDSKRALVIAQNDLTTNFDGEFRNWMPHRNVVNIRGFSKEQRNHLLDMADYIENLVVIINFEAWRKDLALVERLISVGFDTVIIDESHNIKDTASIAYKGCQSITQGINLCPKCQVIMPAMIDVNGKPLKGVQRQCTTCGWAGQSWVDEDNTMTFEERYYHQRSVKRVWCATGTAILNAPQDLFAQLSLIDPINFRKKSDFLDEYCTLGPDGKWRFRSGGADSLVRYRLSGRFLARTMEDAGITLPPQYPVIHDYTITADEYPDQFEVIDQLKRHGQIVMKSGHLKPMAQIALITRQRQANVWPGGIEWTETDEETGAQTIVSVAQSITESIKMDKAIEIIREGIERGERIVVFSQFKKALKEMQSRVNGMMLDSGQVIRSVRFDGDTSDSVRAEVKRNFDKKYGEVAKWDVVLAHYKVGGTGLNYTAAVRTIILDEEWNPGKRDQSYARTRRIGQDQTTFVDVLRLEKTVDTWLARLIDDKEKMIGGFTESALDMQAEYLKAFETGEM